MWTWAPDVCLNGADQAQRFPDGQGRSSPFSDPHARNGNTLPSHILRPRSCRSGPDVASSPVSQSVSSGDPEHGPSPHCAYLIGHQPVLSPETSGEEQLFGATLVPP